MIHSVEKNLKEYGGKIPASDKDTIERDVAALKKELENENADVDSINAKLQALTQSSMKLGEALYKAQAAGGESPQPGPQPGSHPGAGAGDDKVVDADFEEVDEQKKRGSG